LPVLLPVNWWTLVFVALICSLQAEVPGDIHWSSLCDSENFHLYCWLQGPSSCALSFNPLVHLLIGCNWLFFLTECIRHITVRLVTARNIARI
jgi:hypothetical protein